MAQWQNSRFFGKGKALGEEAARVRASKSFTQATSRAKAYLQDDKKLAELVQQATDKAVAHGQPLAQVLEQLTAAFRLVKAYAKGQYRQVPWPTLLMIVAALLYFVMPVDVVPDVLFALGLLDDAALLAWTLSAVKGELDQFKAWESASPASTASAGSPNQPKS